MAPSTTSRTGLPPMPPLAGHAPAPAPTPITRRYPDMSSPEREAPALIAGSHTTLAVVATGEPVMREQVLPGALLTRVAASHLRVGTFQYFAARGEPERAAPGDTGDCPV